MSQKRCKIICGPECIAKKLPTGYEIEFDPGAHSPQEVQVKLTDQEFGRLQANPGEFQLIVVPAMAKQRTVVD